MLPGTAREGQDTGAECSLGKIEHASRVHWFRGGKREEGQREIQPRTRSFPPTAS